jgi:predicted nucleic acid-binding protein
MNEPRNLQFVDTNVLIYAHDVSAGRKHILARDLIRQLWESGKGCLSVQVLQEFYVNITRKVAKPLASDTAVRVIADLAAWQIYRPGVEDVLDAIRLQDQYQTSFWDAMILVSAIQSGCDKVWSEDLNTGQIYDTVTVSSPF